MKRIVVLISGRGSNLRSIVAACRAEAWPASVAAVISNRPDAAGLEWAAAQGIATGVVDHRAYAERTGFDAALAAAVEAHAADVVVLAGFMRILGAPFVERYAGRMINIHPSLLPAYPGTQTHRRALAERATRHGCTVHFVTADVDGGPIIAQADVPVHAGDDEATLAARVLEQEHRLLPQVVAAFCEGRVVLDGGRARIADAARR